MRGFWVLAIVAGCGDNHRCDYDEADDVANASTPETSQLTIGGAAMSLCGNVDGGHVTAGTLDVDRYRVTVGGDGRLLVEIHGDDGAALLTGLEVRIFDTNVNPTLLAAGTFDPKLADFGAFLATVPPGDYDVLVSATAPGDLNGQVAYRIHISADHTDDCKPSGGPQYTESHDGDTDTGNDAVAVDYTKPDSFTMMPGTPEPTGTALAAGTTVIFAGSAGAAARMDQYLDRDTFELSTDDTTNELTVRLDWTGAGDLDYLVFEAGKMIPIGAGQITSASTHEIATFPARASTAYWLWVGRFAPGSGAAIPYQATVCGDHFFH